MRFIILSSHISNVINLLLNIFDSVHTLISNSYNNRKYMILKDLQAAMKRMSRLWSGQFRISYFVPEFQQRFLFKFTKNFDS